MAIILDLIVIGIIVLFGILSARKGFAKALVEFAGFILAAVISVTFSAVIANTVYEKVIQPAVEKRIVSVLGDVAESGANYITDKIWSALPSVVTNHSENSDNGRKALSSHITEEVANGADTAGIAKSACDTIVGPIVVPLIKVISQIILFILLCVIVRFLAVLLNKFFSQKLFGKLNTSLGFILGTLKGSLIAFVFVFLVSTLIAVTEESFLGMTMETVNKTFVFRYISGFNPFINLK